MSWNYRICSTMQEVNIGEYAPIFGIYEVYYNKDGSIYAVSEKSVSIYSDTGVDGIVAEIAKLARAVNHDAIDLDALVFAAPDDSVYN